MVCHCEYWYNDPDAIIPIYPETGQHLINTLALVSLQICQNSQAVDWLQLLQRVVKCIVSVQLLSNYMYLQSHKLPKIWQENFQLPVLWIKYDVRCNPIFTAI